MKIGDLCSRFPITTSPSATLSEVASLMYENHVGSVIVTLSPSERPVAVGIVTDRDIVRAQLNHGADLGRLSARDVMTPDPLCINENESPERAMERLNERDVRRAPVIDSSGALTGIVSTDDIMVKLAQQISAMGRLLERQAVHCVSLKHEVPT
jgi:CBS domain-containing protein